MHPKKNDAHAHIRKWLRLHITFCSAQAHPFLFCAGTSLFLCAGAFLFLVAGASDFVLRSGFAKFTGRRTQDSGQQCLVERPGLGDTYVYNKSKRGMGDQISSKAFQMCCT